MEQQEISLHKAGLHATIRTRVSLLCAMNPVFGKYNDNLTLKKNLNLPDSLISRYILKLMSFLHFIDICRTILFL